MKKLLIDGYKRYDILIPSLSELDFFLTLRGGYKDSKVYALSVVTHPSGGFKPGSSASIETDIKVRARIIRIGYSDPYMDCPVTPYELYVMFEVETDMPPCTMKSADGDKKTFTFTFPALKKGQNIEGAWSPFLSRGEVYIKE